LKAGVWFRRVRLVMLSPDPRHPRRCQAENPLIPLSRFPRPALAEGVSGRDGRDSTEVFESFAGICHVDPDRMARPDFVDIDGQNATSNLRPLVSERRDRCRMSMNERRFARSRAADNVLIFRDA
jgi:hypothetical protein